MKLLSAWHVAGLLLVAVALPCGAQIPTGWNIGGSDAPNYEAGVDNSIQYAGKRSAYIEAKPTASTTGFCTMSQSFSSKDYLGSRLRLSGYMRTDNAGRAQMWMRIDGANNKVLGFDNMDARPVVGSKDWAKYDIVLDVPPDSVRIALGYFLMQKGKVWATSFSLEKVSDTTPVTGTLPESHAPTNLDFQH